MLLGKEMLVHSWYTPYMYNPEIITLSKAKVLNWKHIEFYQTCIYTHKIESKV